MVAFSQVEVLEPDSEKRRQAQRAGTRGQEEVVRLSRHSYCAGLWDADTFGPYQYAEGLRRGFDLLERQSSVNDGAPWIERITQMNFPLVGRSVSLVKSCSVWIGGHGLLPWLVAAIEPPASQPLTSAILRKNGRPAILLHTGQCRPAIRSAVIQLLIRMLSVPCLCLSYVTTFCGFLSFYHFRLELSQSLKIWVIYRAANPSPLNPSTISRSLWASCTA